MRAILLAGAAAAFLIALAGCGDSVTPATAAAPAGSVSSSASSRGTAAGGTAVDCAFKLTISGKALILTASGAGQALCPTLKAQLGSAIAAANAGAVVDVTDPSTATGPVVCSRTEGPLNMNVYGDGADTSGASQFCGGFAKSSSSSSSTSS